MKRLSILAAFGAVLLFPSCSRDSGTASRAAAGDALQPDSPVLAEVGDHKITVKDFERELERRNRAHPGTYATENERHKLLQEMVRFQVLLARAKAAGYDRRPEIQARLNEFIVARFQEDQWAKHAPRPPSDADVRRFYDQHPERFTSPAAARVALIYIRCSPKATDAKRQEMRRKAEGVLAEARATDTAGFARLAQQHSADQSTRYLGGDAGWVQEDAPAPRWDPAVAQAGLKLSEPGSFAPLVETPDGFYIVRLLEKKPGGVRSFDQVKEAIAYQLAQQEKYQQQQEFFEEMKRGLKVEVHPDALKSVSTPGRTADSNPPPLPRS